MPDLTYPEAIVIGLLQGVSELFPVSSLGHSVLLPALIGGKWAQDLSVTAEGSPYLAVLVAMHVATAAALVIFFWRDWVRVVGGLVTSIRERRIDTPEQRLAWLLVAGTIPVGLVGVVLDRVAREYLGKPVPSALFLIINGVLLYVVERLRRGRDEEDDLPVELRDTVVFATEETRPLTAVAVDVASDRRLSRLSVKEALVIGSAQILGLFPGFSRSGATIATGLLRGLRHEDAARFAFLLATPVILAAGVYKVPDLFGSLGNGIRGQVLAGSVAAFLAAFASAKFLVRWFRTRTLVPFAVYCLVVGLASVVRFA
jgi:undecaprenyl-diphosphatase